MSVDQQRCNEELVTLLRGVGRVVLKELQSWRDSETSNGKIHRDSAVSPCESESERVIECCHLYDILPGQ